MTARVRQELIRRPLTRTVQAPHWPWSHPFFVPVWSRYSRRASSRVVQGATSICFAVPFTFRVIRDFGGNEGVAVPTLAGSGCLLMGPPAQGHHAGQVTRLTPLLGFLRSLPPQTLTRLLDPLHLEIDFAAVPGAGQDQQIARAAALVPGKDPAVFRNVALQPRGLAG